MLFKDLASFKPNLIASVDQQIEEATPSGRGNASVDFMEKFSKELVNPTQGTYDRWGSYTGSEPIPEGKYLKFKTDPKTGQCADVFLQESMVHQLYNTKSKAGRYLTEAGAARYAVVWCNFVYEVSLFLKELVGDDSGKHTKALLEYCLNEFKGAPTLAYKPSNIGKMARVFCEDNDIPVQAEAGPARVRESNPSPDEFVIDDDKYTGASRGDLLATWNRTIHAIESSDDKEAILTMLQTAVKAANDLKANGHISELQHVNYLSMARKLVKDRVAVIEFKAKEAAEDKAPTSKLSFAGHLEAIAAAKSYPKAKMHAVEANRLLARSYKAGATPEDQYQLQSKIVRETLAEAKHVIKETAKA